MLAAVAFVAFVIADVPPAREAERQEQAAPFVVEGAWIRLPPPTAKAAAGYLVITNRSDSADALVAVSTSISPRAELHTQLHIDGKMAMRKVDEIALPPRAAVTLKPGSLHLMLFDLVVPPAGFQADDLVAVELRTKLGRRVRLDVPLRREAPTPSITPQPTSAPPPPG
jgi:copper(I)-binding protein